jgi:ketosteroid isomerase-like protein
MSRENVEVVRRATAAFNRGGVEAALQFFDPEIEWTTTGIFLEAGTYSGYEGVLEYMGALATELEELHSEPESFLDAGDQVVVAFRLSGRGKQSGAPVVFTGCLVYTLRDGKIVRIRNHTDRDEALEAAGLRRGPLQPGEGPSQLRPDL